MTRINLLPWREQLRKERERRFYTAAAGAALLMVLVVVYVHFHIGRLIEAQEARNQYLRQVIAQVDQQIKEIKDLEAQKERLLARMRIIERLQGQRPQEVHLFDELVRAVPDGLYLTELDQKGAKVTLKGVAESNARVSAFMRRLDASPWFERPTLAVIEAAGPEEQRVSRFELEVLLTGPHAEAAQAEGAGQAAAGRSGGRGRPA
ncbi:MAG: pilus assembly protein PilN, partial [Gammaproteobacteria bacterium]